MPFLTENTEAWSGHSYVHNLQISVVIQSCLSIFFLIGPEHFKTYLNNYNIDVLYLSCVLVNMSSELINTLMLSDA